MNRTQVQTGKIPVKLNTVKVKFKEVPIRDESELEQEIEKLIEQVGFNGVAVFFDSRNGTVSIYWKKSGYQNGTSYTIEEFVEEVARRVSDYLEFHDVEFRDLYDVFAIAVEEMTGAGRDGVHFYEVTSNNTLRYAVTKFVVPKLFPLASAKSQ